MNISVIQNHAEEKRRDAEFWSLQKDILERYGTKTPENPKLEVRQGTLSPDQLSLTTRFVAAKRHPNIRDAGMAAYPTRDREVEVS